MLVGNYTTKKLGNILVNNDKLGDKSYWYLLIIEDESDY